jgi:hypothetical protein
MARRQNQPTPRSPASCVRPPIFWPCSGRTRFGLPPIAGPGESILALTRDLGIIVARGARKALEAIPGVGVSIAGAWHLSSAFSRSTP